MERQRTAGLPRMLSLLLLLAVFWLAYSNGANDNFKGVATLYGSGAASFRRALALATAATVAGSVASALAGAALVQAFRGGGLVPDALTGSPRLLFSVGSAAAITILLATHLGMPTSTTHALMGALLGCAIAAAGRIAQPGVLLSGFVRPLLFSPLVAAMGAALGYGLLRAVARGFGIAGSSCVCVEAGAQPAGTLSDGSAVLAVPAAGVYVDRVEQCVARYGERLPGVRMRSLLDLAHHCSGAAVCFSRAVNDTPKIAALLMASGGAGGWKLLLVAAAMAVGGLLGSRKVAETMGRRITDLSPGQGLAANLATSAVVLSASTFGLPVSTTHVSCGSIFGIGIVGGRARWKTILQILGAWVTTLPLAAVLGALLFRLAVAIP